MRPIRRWPYIREGGGEDTDGYRRHQSSKQDGRVQRGRGLRSDHKNTLPLGGRVEGQVRLYGERGGGGQTERWAPQESKREIDCRRRHANPGDACQCVKGLKTIAGGAVSFANPPTPKPRTTSRTGRGGGANLHMGRWGRKPGEDIGQPKPEVW